MTPIVAFLQNQWFPASKHRIINHFYAKHGTTLEGRAELNARYLFFRCRTGKVLKTVFGELTDKIIWEEASPKLASEASGAFPADPAHIDSVLRYWKPGIVLTFGRVAGEAIALWQQQNRGDLQSPQIEIVRGPHPTARYATKDQELRQMLTELRRLSRR